MNASDLRLIDLMLTNLETRLMSELTDKIAEAVTSFDAAQVRVETAVAELRAQIEDLRTKAVTPEDLAALTGLDTKIDALDPRLPEVLPPEG